MTIDIRPYTEDLIGPVAEFNRRISAAKTAFLIPETPVPSWLPKRRGQSVYQERFLALENGFVRGAYTLKRQDFSFSGHVLSIGFYQNPISEGVADKRYILVGANLMNDALRRQPLLYDLGIGSLDAAIARMHEAMGWRLRVVPFFFKILNGFQFCKNMPYLKSDWRRRLMMNVAAYSGIGWTAAKILGVIMRIRGAGTGPVFADEVREFQGWADKLWDACQTQYSMAAVRDSGVLNILYPLHDKRFIKLKIRDRNAVIGWAVCLNTAMSADKYFGDMRVGSIVDCLALPQNADRVIAAATRVLKKRGADLLISNQSHPAWRRACKRAGFLNGSSNYVFATSKKLTHLLDQIDPSETGIHLTRGDGDGPIHL